MARTKEKAPSFASVIRGYFEENPEWLRGPSNQALIDRYRKDYPGEEWTKKHQQGAANEKTKLRKKAGLVRRNRRKRGRPSAADSAAANESRVARVRPSMGALEQLELLIDDCLSLAARQNDPSLEGTVKHLRVARRSVAWAMGEPSPARR
jgi:hypothetical protein